MSRIDTGTVVQSPPRSVHRHEEMRTLKLADIVASPTNPRKTFPPDYIADLSRSLAEKGLMQPIVVRPGKQQSLPFEIVAGECRFRAARQAGWDEMRAIVRDYTDDEVLELQLIENIHRRDLTPLEEAVGYRQLIDSNPDKHSAESIAARIGMSAQYVWDRMKLNDLIPEAKMLLETERIAAGHAILIARQTPEHQARIISPDEVRHFVARRSALWRQEHDGLDFEDEQTEDPYAGLKPVSVRELERWIADHVRLDVAQAFEAQPFQFEETARAVAIAEAQPGRGKKVIAITHGYHVQEDARDEKERTYGSQAWERADGQEKSKTCEHSVLGVVKAGPGRGSVLQVCVARDRCKVHFAQEVRDKERREKERATRNAQPVKRAVSPTTGTQRSTAQLEKERLDAQRREWRTIAWDIERPKAIRAFTAFVGTLKLSATLVKAVLHHVAVNYMELRSAESVKNDFGVALTDRTALQVFLLATVYVHEDQDFESFCDEVKPFGFKTDAIAKAIDKAVAEAEAADEARRKPLQTSGVQSGSATKKQPVSKKPATAKGKKAGKAKGKRAG